MIDLDSALAKRVLFMGEEIIDDYYYGTLLGRTMKEPILCLAHDSSDSFDGGVVAAAKHAVSFCAKVDVASDRTILKLRYVERAHIRKLFEVYRPLSIRNMHVDLSDYDAVIVTDYGHGMFTEALVERVCREARFLAVNVQANSGNYGYNLATKWPRADYLCMDEQEARLATQNQHGDIRKSIGDLKFIAPVIAVTLGGAGAIGWSLAEGFSEVPAFTTPVVDTIGAGDAFFVISALFADTASIAELLRIGNAAGAVKVKILGHSGSVTKALLEKYL